MSGRPKRRTVLRKTALPDATHYVGYVEDDETPEMIMRKFEELERIKAAAGSNKRTPGAASTEASTPDDPGPSTANQSPALTEDEGQLDQDQLIEVFKATSMYNVKSLLGNNEALMAAGRPQQGRVGPLSDFGGSGIGENDEDLDELRGFWSDEDWGKASRKQRQRGPRMTSSKATDGRRQRAMQRNQRACMITHYNRDTHAFIRRRMRVIDPDAVLQLKIPRPPLPLSWGRVVRPYQQHVEQPHAATAAAAAAASQEVSGQQPTAVSAVAPRGLLGRPHALPVSRNCDPVVRNSNTSSSSISTDPTGPEETTAAAAAAAVPPAAPNADSCQVHVTSDIPSFDFSSLKGQQYQAVLINTGWEVRSQQQQQQQQPAQQQQQTSAGVHSWSEAACCGVGDFSNSRSSKNELVKRLAAVPLAKLCPRGFIMIWVNKEHLSAVVRVMSSFGFSYVENLTWVLLHPNHSVLRLPSQLIKRSHITLYIFRKDGEGRDIQLRHQRNPDVVFDCVRAVEGREWDVPAEVFTTIETLLPTGKGAFLELWAPKEAGRAGWTHLVEQAA